MYTITIKDERNEFKFENQYSDTALLNYLFVNFYHPCHVGTDHYMGKIRKKLIKPYDIIDVDNIKKTSLSWRIPVIRKGKKKVIKAYFVKTA